MKKTLVVGDIHGCFDEFLLLLEAAGIGPQDEVISVGDLVDRGPKSFEVVQYFIERKNRFFAVRGNHEQKHLRCRAGSINSLAGRIVRTTTSAENYSKMLDYFASLPYSIELDLAIVVHAGIDPGVDLAHQDPKTVMGIGSIKREGFDGRSSWWYDDLRLNGSKPIIFGHETSPIVKRGGGGRVWGIDTGAAVGGQLTGLLLPEFRLVSVETPNYWAEQSAYWRFRFAAEDLLGLPWDQVLALPGAPPHWHDDEINCLQELRDCYHCLVSDVAEMVRTLKSKSRYQQLSAVEKRLLRARLLEDSEQESPIFRLALSCMNGADVHEVVKKQLPTPEALRIFSKSLSAKAEMT